MEDLQIFDKNGKVLNIADVMYSFIKNMAEEHNKDVEDVYVGVEVGSSKDKPTWIHIAESVYNGCDAVELYSFGNPIKVDCI